MLIIGLDEAGRGPLLGPLTLGAAVIPESDINLLTEQGVKDSKKLSSKKRNQILQSLKNHEEVQGWLLCTSSIEPEEIDYGMQHGTLNEIEIIGFAELISDIKKRLSRNKGFENTRVEIQIDAADVKEDRFGRDIAARLRDWPWKNWTIISKHKADEKYPAVAAASIIAKVTRDLKIEKLSLETGIDLGSGYPSDKKTREVLHLLLMGEEPHECLRWGWKSIQNAWLKQKNSIIPLRKKPDNWGLFTGQSTLSDF